jgi:opacity protein-like surface antigen
MSKHILIKALALFLLFNNEVNAENYLGISMGYSGLSNYDYQSKGLNKVIPSKLSFDSGVSVSGRAGIIHQNGWRTELGYMWQNVDIDSNTASSGNVDLHDITVSFLYDFAKVNNLNLKPFIGIGAGAVYADGDVVFPNDTKSFSGWAPAVKAQAGFQVELTETTDLIFNYSALIFPDDSAGINNTMLQHSLNVGFNLSF